MSVDSQPFETFTYNKIRENFERLLWAIIAVLVLIGALIASLTFDNTFGYIIATFLLGGAFFLTVLFGLQIREHLGAGKKDIAAPIEKTEFAENIKPEVSLSVDMFDELPVPMIETSSEGKILNANSAACDLLGNRSIKGTSVSELLEGMGRSIKDRLSDTMKGYAQGRPEMARHHPDGQEAFIKLSMSKMKRGRKTTILMVLNDATELKTLEAQFVQSQKMQAVGQLAGGVAHDFNNILTAITGHADLLLLRHDAIDPDYDDLMQIKQNSNRAAALIGQLLAFSRKQTLRPKSLHLNETLAELSHLLNRLLGGKVALHTDNGKNLKTVRVDERQFEQVIMNLVVNARDAMPNGGTVMLRTRNHHLDKEFRCDRAVVPPGDYVIVEVRDTGDGIPKDKLPKIFEPFFTTKKVGKGTGLGLSTVYGIVKQTGGFIFAESEEGAGSLFTIYLPVNEDVEIERPEFNNLENPPSDLTGRGNVLLVEDEAPVRSFASRALSMRGYSVTEASSGDEALEVLAECQIQFDVIISDVVMPGKDGPTWVAEAMETLPDIRVVFISGYAEGAFSNGGKDIPNASFLAKPFSLRELTQKVKEQIDA